MKPKVSVLILAKEEEANLPGCLDALGWCDDVVVFDSLSRDRGPAIARARGARVLRHAFRDYGSQREAARTKVRYRHPWVLALDADERPDAELVEELKFLPDSGPVAYRMRRKDHFRGVWIRHATLYPSWFLRLYRPEALRYGPRAVHEVPEVLGAQGSLKGHLLHYSFNKGLGEWWRKHASYAEMEARMALAGGDALDLAGLFALGDPLRRRRALKVLGMRLPFRPQLRFLYTALWRGGLLDGRAGLDYCRMLACYEAMISLNLRALRAGQR